MVVESAQSNYPTGFTPVVYGPLHYTSRVTLKAE